MNGLQTAEHNAWNPAPNNQRPHKSTTHEEQFYHVIHAWKGFKGGTVFFRRNNETSWTGAVSVCAPEDQFSRKRGRTVSRRRFFQQPEHNFIMTGEPSYDTAESLVLNAISGLAAARLMKILKIKDTVAFG
jgi:hypothetical protein